MPRTTKALPKASSDILPPKRRRGRPPKSAQSQQITTPLEPIIRKEFLGYSVSKDAKGYRIYQDHEERRGDSRRVITTDSHIQIPPSLETRLADQEFQKKIAGLCERVRHELFHRDNYKLHLQKDASDHVYFSYSIDGSPTTHFFVHPSRIDVSPRAFESPEEHDSFHTAVAHQNFSNKAYKKWRETVRAQFLDEVLSFELVKKMGSDQERDEALKAQSAIMHGHKGAERVRANGEKRVIPMAVVEKKEALPVAIHEERATEEPQETISIEPPEEVEEPKPIQAPKTPEVTIQGGQGHMPPERQPLPAAPLPKPAVPSRIQVTTRPSVPLLTNVKAPEELPEYVEAKKAYMAALHALKPFEGILGAFRKELQHNDYVKHAKVFQAAKERYDNARRDYAVFVLTRHIASALGSVKLDMAVQRRWVPLSFWVFQGQAIFSQNRLGHLVGEPRYQQYEEWLRRADRSLDMQLELRTLLNMATLEGMVKSALLGSMPGLVYDNDPAQTVRIMAGCSADLGHLRERLQEGFGIDACRVPEMTFGQRRTLEEMIDLSHMRDVLTMLEFHARLRGEILSMEKHHTTYCDLYTQLYEKYYRTVTNPEGRVSVTEALGQEKASIALTENLLRQGTTLNEYAQAKPEGVRFLTTVEKQTAPEHLHQLSRLFSLSRWQGTELGKRASSLWTRWHEGETLRRAGILYLTLEQGETLLGSLRRAIWAHADQFNNVAGEGEEKAYTLLRQVYVQLGFSTLPSEPREWLRLGNQGDRVYFDNKGQAWYANTSGREAGFLEMDEFEGFIKGTPEYVLFKLVHDEDENVFMEYIKDFPDVFLNYYEKKIDLISEAMRNDLRQRVEDLNAQDHDSREESESFFRAFYQRHHQDSVEKVG